MHVIDLTREESRSVVLRHHTTRRAFFAASIDAGACAVCARYTFLFNDRTPLRLCNACCATHKGVVVMASAHGYGAFALARATGPFPEPHIDPPSAFAEPVGETVVFSRGTVVCEMGGVPRSAAELDALYGALGTPYAADARDGVALDSTTARNAAAYINSGADPNVRMYADAGRVLVEATRDIRHGEEITLDYGADFPWDVACDVYDGARPFTIVLSPSLQPVLVL